ncbi:MAG: hypothetical protein HY906_13615 [Deltaproteobacteria bacterium]|nr:hypothetical protein [Deltaproteobacteria bacterium]
MEPVASCDRRRCALPALLVAVVLAAPPGCGSSRSVSLTCRHPASAAVTSEVQ